jgi:DNA modification methylase
MELNQIVINGDNIELLKNYPDNYFDAVVTDPPYGLGKEPNAQELMKDWVEKGFHEIGGTGFMGKKWDAFIPQPVFWKEVFRVLKHGGHVLSFFGTRTYDWGVMSMRFAGFEVRDCIQWLYGSGFPKSHNISKAIDKKPNLEKVKDWKRWLELQINNSIKSQKDINLECGFNAIGYARYDSNDYWATNRPNLEKWEKMKNAIGIKTTEWDFICDSNAEERGYVDSTSGLSGGSGNTVGRFTGKELSNNSIASAAKKWDGWGTALKPANEPIVLARKPLEKGLSVAENILKWGVGGINIDASRIGTNGEKWSVPMWKSGVVNPKTPNFVSERIDVMHETNGLGRFPANIIFTHHEDCECKGTKKVKAIKGGRIGNKNGAYSGIGAVGFSKEFSKGDGGYGDENGQEELENWDCHEDCPIRILDEQSGVSKSVIRKPNGKPILNVEKGWNNNSMIDESIRGINDKGGASRFFYVAKASKAERNKGLEGFDNKQISDKKGNGLGRVCNFCGANIIHPCNCENNEWILPISNKNFHPTVKPIKLMQYLVKMITPPKGIVLDPFCGSGTTGVACKLDGFQFVGLEQDPEYAKIAEARITNYEPEVSIAKKSKEKNNIEQIPLF